METLKGCKLVITVIIFAPLLYVAGCENSFEPLQENDRYHFSIFGALDFSVDTQWVRVMPLTDSLYIEDTEPIDAEVTLTRQSTGEVIVLTDTLIQYSKDVYAWNFWTTMPIHEQESYTIKAEASDGRTSSATATIPPDFTMPVVNYSIEEEKGTVYGSGIERLVVADIFYTVRVLDSCSRAESLPRVIISHLSRTEFSANGGFQFYPDDRQELIEELNAADPCYQVTILDREVLLVSGSPEWPHYEELSRDEILFPEISSNVENGLGVLTGIVSKRFPLE